MSTNYGLGSAVDHDLKSANPPPRYMFMFAERIETPAGAPGDEDPVFGFRSATTIAGIDARFVAGILAGSLPTPEHNITVSELSAGIIGETDRITVKPGLVFNPQSAASVAVEGSVYFDSDTGELMLYTGGWTALSTGSGMSAHALDGSFHTGTLPWTDMVVGTQGGIVRRGAADWEEYAIGTEDYVLKAGATDVVWGQVDYSELSGTPPATAAHVLATSGPHTGTLPWAELDFTSSSLADLTTRTHASLSDAPTDAHHVAFVLSDFTTAFAAESLANLTTRTHASLSDAPEGAHHPKQHAIDSVTEHSATGLTVGWVLSADGATTYSWKAPAAAGAHDLTSATHTDSGLTAGHFLKADDPTTFSWQVHGLTASDVGAVDSSTYGSHDHSSGDPTQVTYTDLASIPSTFAPSAHTMVSTTHTDSGLTTGYVIRASGTTTMAWAQLDYTDLANIPSSFTPAAHVLATTGPHSGTLPLADLAAGTAGSLIVRGATDWEERVLGGLGTFLKAGATDASWVAVNYDDLIGTQPAPIAHVLATSGPHTGTLPLDEIASYARGSLIYGNATVWAALGLGTNTYVLKSGATDVAWGQVDYSELAGTQPAPVAHDLATTGPHTSTLPLTDLAVGTAGSVIVRGATDWEELPLGTQTYVLKSGVTAVSWEQVDYSELAGTQPAPVSHTLQSHTGDLAYTQLDDIVDIAGTGGSALISRADHVHTDADGSSKVTYANLASIPSTFAPTAHGESDHSGDVFPAANQDLGAFYIDIDDIAAPADPASTVRRIFVDTATGKLSVRTSTSATVSLEESGGSTPALSTVLGIGNETNGANIIIDSAGDLIVYSDDVVTEKARIDGTTGDITTAGDLTVATIAAESTDVDKFLVSNAGLVKFRTGAQVLSDIGAGDGTGTGYSATSTAMEVMNANAGGSSSSNESWTITTSLQYFMIDINTLLPVTTYDGTIKITTVKAYFTTDHSSNYITLSSWNKILLTTGATTSIHSDSTDTGNGSTGNVTRTMTVNYTKQAGYALRPIFMQATIFSGSVILRGIEVFYEIV